MKKEAESHADDDAKKQAMAESKNKLDATIFSLEKILKENKGKIKEADKKQAYADLYGTVVKAAPVQIISRR